MYAKILYLLKEKMFPSDRIFYEKVNNFTKSIVR